MKFTVTGHLPNMKIIEGRDERGIRYGILEPIQIGNTGQYFKEDWIGKTIDIPLVIASVYISVGECAFAEQP